MVPLSIVLALFWGMLWAVFLQCTDYGRFLALRRTWLAVVIGVGGDLLIALIIVPPETWLLFCAVIIASSVGIIARSLHNEIQDERAIQELANGR